MNASMANRPNLSEADIQSLARTKFSFDAKVVKPLGGYVDQNFLVQSETGEQLLIKAHSRVEREEVLNLQHCALRHLQTKNLNFSVPDPFCTTDGNPVAVVENNRISERVRCLSFLDGELLAQRGTLTSSLLRSAGGVVAALDSALQDFHHPAAARPDMDWDLRNAPRIARFVSHIADPALRRLADYFFLQFEMEVQSELYELPLQISHNDGHRFSLLVDGKSDQSRVSGVIDFGDVVLTHAVCHLAVTISDLIVGQEDLVVSAALIVSGYHQVRPLTHLEVGLIYQLVGVRLAMYAAMAGKALVDDPSNQHPQSKLVDVKNVLRRLTAINPLAWREAMLAACSLSDGKDERSASSERLIEQRGRFFSPSLYTHYAKPIVLERSAFQYFYDQDGKTYLDCVNNVCQWGHCHPTIVRAAQRQMTQLNTNSRYVYAQMASFAERLTETMPEGLDTVFFVNSGSEANDLAARLARAYTGQNDFIVVDRAYHGNSSLSTDLSPNRIDRPGRPGLPSYVRKTECPDVYRGKFRDDDPDASSKYIQDLMSVINQMEGRDRAPAAFFAESLVGTGGQIVFPDGYLQAAYDSVRSAGGVCVADEVQVGFGRTGEHMWCFQTQQVVPDIVTMGKPIANGHPMAAVVTRREIAEAFDNGVTYFNTFGGNPVSCAIGLACLDVLQGEDLMRNTRDLSAQLMTGLLTLKNRYSLIGDVRGLGLYIGVELVDDLVARTPATAQAKRIVELMKIHGVLMNTNGYDGNIIKIKPPLMVDGRDIEQLLVALESSIEQVSQECSA